MEVLRLSQIRLPLSVKIQLYKTQNIDFYYPFLYNVSNPIAQNLMNRDIYEKMITIIDSLIVPEIPTQVMGSFEVKNNQKGVFSVSLIGLGDFRGAHPMTIIKSQNYDIDSGRSYQLSEQFKPGSNYIEILSNMVYEELRKQDLPLFEEYPGIRPEQDYYIADKSIIIYFQLYEVAPYYVGFPYAVIPIYNLLDIVREDSLLSKMVESV